ncbi:maestro heat-like repeat-containing protein family member 1 [Paramacrobiotus metropolitanus]|uniref:maestro heat-like repeat-containing protein family member 1 n=1 Tax=Paramacrobiotus metropolitanus TaxID=2943436 RepID=UPI0024461ECC|nr:maestro heat-like repeat-containing protein family member 1 [Paramacrobiotus metropolitanus]XP_055357869.1 maestro heat-like repeat-containing protein family member 1 [Paramacrobiotus metropolitanus]XP_055357870.1 maestro heat-like repeat-containing protein family member 1 [Paramacrobiotus metropolitanus]XP_055357871.1 maestro heat-like repeat-containing protein family member 1 [Paramacrobiotus metropolitanus]
MDLPETPKDAINLDIQKIISALVEAENDKEKDDSVKSQISNSVYALGIKHPSSVIPALLAYRKQQHISRQQKLLILTTINSIIDHADLLSKLDEKLAIYIIEAAVASLNDKELVEIGSDLLVSMSRNFCIEVMKQMLNLFQPGILPTVTTFQTFGRIFSANVYDSIPFLSAVLSMLIPMLPEAKNEPIRKAICSAVSQFSEALLEYVANENEAPDPSVKISFYSHEFNAIFEYILNNWLAKVRDPELASYVLHALSSVARVISKEKLQEQAERLLSSAVAIVRRHPHESNATAGLAVVLEILASNVRSTLEPQLDGLIDVIFAQACAPPDYSKPMGVKSHNEVLRCFAILHLNFPDKIISFLFGKLSPNVLKMTVNKDATDRTVVGALTIINKLVNQQDVSFSFYVTPLLKALDPIVSPTPPVALSNNIKLSVGQLILTLADRQYLTLENSPQLIEFVIRQCAVPATTIPRSPSGLESITDEALRASCENVLHLLTTTVQGMESHLLPSLFDFVVDGRYTEAVRTVARCLCHLNTKQDIFASLPNGIPGKHPTLLELFTRLFVLSGSVAEKADDEALLRLLQLVATRISDVIKELWDGTIDELEVFVKTTADRWDEKAWHESLLKLLNTSLRDLRNVEPDLVNRITECFASQITLYTEYPNEKAFLYLALGSALEIANDPLVVNKALDGIFSNVFHQKLTERQACAAATGHASASHFDLILSKLDGFSSKESHGKRSSFLNIFSGGKDKQDNMDEKTKATMVLCYAHAVVGAPKPLVLARIDDIMRSIMPLFVGAKDFATKHALCRLTEMLAKTLRETNTPLEKRANLMFHMKDFVKSEPSELRSSVRALAITACSELALLPPKIPMEEMEDALLLFCNNVFPLLPPRHDSASPMQLDLTNNAYLNYEVLWEATCTALTEFMITMIRIYRNSEALTALLKTLKPFLESDSDHERYHSLVTLYRVVQSDAMSELIISPVLGMLSGMMATRAVDPDARCRETALQCGSQIAAVATMNKDADEGWTEAAKSSWLKESLTSHAYATKVAGLFFKILEGEQLLKYVRQLYYQGLMEKRVLTAAGIGAILQATLKHKYGPVSGQSVEIVAGLLYALKFLKESTVKVAVEGCIRAIAEHDTNIVAQVLMNQPVPLHASVADLWRSLGAVPAFASVLLVHCLDALRNGPLFAEVHPSVKCVSLPVLQSLAVLTELFQASGNVELLQANFADIFPVLMVTAAAMVGAQPPKPPFVAIASENSAVDAEWKQVYKVNPSRLAVDCLKQLLKNTNSVVPISFEMMEDTGMYAEGLYVTSKCVFQSVDINTGKIVSNLAPYLDLEIDAQRAAAVAMYAAMLESKKPSNHSQLAMVVNHLGTKSSDQASVVRIFCIRGIGSLSNFGPDMVDAHAPVILKVILAGLDDSADNGMTSAPVEAMKALNRIIPIIDRSRIQDDLISFALRLRPSFESDTPMIRGMAFALFGQLAAAAEGDHIKEAFVQEIHNLMVILLLHLNDEYIEVSLSTKAVFRLLLPLMKSEGMNNAFSYPDGITYGRLLRLLCTSLGTEHPDKIPMYINLVIGYFRSESAAMRSNAALLAGNLVSQATAANEKNALPGHIYPSLVQMLSDKDATVRLRAAEALGMLY